MPHSAQRTSAQFCGRPRRSAIDVMRVRLWFFAVASRLGIHATGYAFEVYFDGYSPSSGKARTRKWDKYKNGSRVPSAKTVALVELHCPGVAAYLELPLWDILSAAHPDEEKAWKAIYRLSHCLFDGIYLGTLDGLRAARKCPLAEQLILRPLFIKLDIESFTFLIWYFQQAKQQDAMLKAYDIEYSIRNVFRRLLLSTPFVFIANELFDYLQQFLFGSDYERVAGDAWDFGRVSPDNTLAFHGDALQITEGPSSNASASRKPQC